MARLKLSGQVQRSYFGHRGLGIRLYILICCSIATYLIHLLLSSGPALTNAGLEPRRTSYSTGIGQRSAPMGYTRNGHSHHSPPKSLSEQSLSSFSLSAIFQMICRRRALCQIRIDTPTSEPLFFGWYLPSCMIRLGRMPGDSWPHQSLEQSKSFSEVRRAQRLTLYLHSKACFASWSVGGPSMRALDCSDSKRANKTLCDSC